MALELPYDPSRDEIFWRTAVANIHTGIDNFNMLTSKFDIESHHRISSAGSCFAQHIGNWLTQNNYSYNRSQLNRDEVSSFAFGNIYTPRSLLQWFVCSDDELSEHSVYFEEESGRYYDLLLPRAAEAGYQSREELLAYRVLVMEETRAQLAQSECFIFTLGLIETWNDSKGLCYPSCPGVKLGVYDSEKYKLKVFNYQEIFSDLSELFKQIKVVNPSIRFVLTVSPVPLTATATDAHVLVANSYSKSVLRAVAGAFCQEREDVSYFPSFELITTPLPEDFRYLENRRTVSEKGVSYVMRHWAKSLNGKRTPEVSSIEAVCDDEMLDAIKKAHSSEVGAQLTLIGDSHFGKLAKSFERLGQPCCGGMVMNGSGFAQHKFSLTTDNDIMVPLESAESRRLWLRIVNNLDSLCSAQRQSESWVLTNIGLQTHQTVSMFVRWMKAERPDRLNRIGMEDYVEFFNANMRDQMTIVFRLKEFGFRVMVISDTPFWQYFEESKEMAPLVMAYMDAIEYVWQQMGVEFFHAARIFNEEISDPMSYASTLVYSDGSRDYFHGGDRYYDWLAEKLLPLLKE
ncbi:GSCFA domain-containing protein [Shewanella sp. JM162201]|uniref:GSCFA domain-containing protein n=1 Tax=Shewanella jiangmenensis TaxID=2837387 RepID=A0ABS5V1N6_9GAMM|nr:GSCFA domain-containing protein [Shewanella jiangmenensis]MBT1444384.1 GSCFA domain-containing protein [Shewanella jiangmenensis]